MHVLGGVLTGTSIREDMGAWVSQTVNSMTCNSWILGDVGNEEDTYGLFLLVGRQTRGTW